MQQTLQKRAIWLWHGLPHMLIWLSVLIFAALFGFGNSFAGLQPALPLMVALLWCWEWRSIGIALSLVLAGFLVDMLSGMPIGWHALLWVGCYGLLPNLVHQLPPDEPFFRRWLLCGLWLGGLLLAELLLGWAFSFATPDIISFLVRWLIMCLLLPPIGWMLGAGKRAFHRKLWMHLPEDI